MVYKGRLTKQVEDAISTLIEEGSIVIPMNNEQYEASKDYKKICILENIHNIQKNINWQVQMRLFEAVRQELLRQDKKITTLPDEGIIRLR
jgi:predicted glycosyltransferase